MKTEGHKSFLVNPFLSMKTTKSKRSLLEPKNVGPPSFSSEHKSDPGPPYAEKKTIGGCDGCANTRAGTQRLARAHPRAPRIQLTHLTHSTLGRPLLTRQTRGSELTHCLGAACHARTAPFSLHQDQQWHKDRRKGN